MKSGLILSICLFIISCETTKETTLRDANRKGLPFDIVQDTLIKSRINRKGQLTYEEYILNDKRLFLRQYHYKNGVIWEIHQGKTFFKDDGFSYAYFPNGQLKIVSFFKNGKEHGQRLTFYEDGAKQCVCSYENGNRSGLQAIYWENGQLFSKEEYQNGRLWQIQERYHKDGRKMPFGTFEKGNGELKRYDDRGILETIEYYKDGKKVKSEITKK
jgi:antitoxin component YwqK of YwqJK toxin-antitoxin module